MQKDGFVKDCRTCAKRGVRKYKSGKIDTCLACKGKGWMNEQDVANHELWQKRWKHQNLNIPELREIEFWEWEHKRQLKTNPNGITDKGPKSK